jgi:hypothetical protein
MPYSLAYLLRRRGNVRDPQKQQKSRVSDYAARRSNSLRKNLFQCLVYPREQLVQVCRFVESMHHFGYDLPLGFHALQIGYVPAAENDPLNDRVSCVIFR